MVGPGAPTKIAANKSLELTIVQLPTRLHKVRVTCDHVDAVGYSLDLSHHCFKAFCLTIHVRIDR
jgi:hypothetical protein